MAAGRGVALDRRNKRLFTFRSLRELNCLALNLQGRHKGGFHNSNLSIYGQLVYCPPGFIEASKATQAPASISHLSQLQQPAIVIYGCPNQKRTALVRNAKANCVRRILRKKVAKF